MVHAVRDFTFVCDLCVTFKNKQQGSVGCHRRYCKGPPVPIEKAFKCIHCELSFDKAVGLTQHVRWKHEEQYNEGLVASTQTKYSVEELRSMARIEAIANRETGRVNVTKSHLAPAFPHRTVPAINKIRQKVGYKTLYKEESLALTIDQACDECMQQCIESELSDLIELMARLEGPVGEAGVRDEYVYVPRPGLEVVVEEWPDGNDVDLSGEIPIWTELEDPHQNDCQRALYEFLERDFDDTLEVNDVTRAYLRGDLDYENLKRVLSEVISVKRKPPRKRKKNWKKAPAARNRRNNRNTRKWQRFKLVQEGLERNKKKTMRDLIDGTFQYENETEEFPSIEKIEDMYQKKLGEAKADSTPPEALPEPDVDVITYGRISTEEISKALKKTGSNTSPGLDGWSLPFVLGIGMDNLAMIFNKWAVEGCPAGEKACRTVLIHKGGDRSEVGNFRPITIGNILLRIYAKIWDDRLRRKIEISLRQKAFIPTDGCYENVKILQEIIKSSRRGKCRRELNIVLLDLAKAFDSVSHQTIYNSLRRNGVPSHVISVIMDLYRDASTVVRTPNGETSAINIKAGVKQGCPLSPFLFNLVMDSLVLELQGSNMGFDIYGEKVAVMAFADDLVLISDNNYHMNSLMRIAENFFDLRGLKVNAKKSLSYRHVPVSKDSNKKNVKVEVDVHRFWKNSAIPVMGYDSLAKYLGVKLTPKGDIELPWEQCEEWLRNIDKAPLKPEQKVEALNDYIVPRMLHQLRLSNVGISKLKRLSRLLRSWVRKVLHLPIWTPTDWIHGSFGGMLANIEELIFKTRKKASDRMLASRDTVAFWVGNKEDRINTNGLRSLRADHVETKGLKGLFEKRRLEGLHEHHNGLSLTTMAKSVVGRRWLWKSRLASGQKINCLKLTCDLFPTKVNLTKGSNHPAEKLCRRCKQWRESQKHILNGCPANRLAYCRRHNNVADAVATDLFGDHWKTTRERCWRVLNANGRGWANIKPDISYHDKAKKSLLIIDITCPYEKSEEALDKSATDKVEKYTIRPERFGLDLEKVTVHAVVIGSCGTITKNGYNRLRKLGVARMARKYSCIAMVGSAKIIQGHCTNDDLSRNREEAQV